MSIPGYDRWKTRSDRDEGPQEEPEPDLLHCILCGSDFYEDEMATFGCADPYCPLYSPKP